MDLLPTFAVIKDIVAYNVDEFYFVCEVLDTVCFAQHFHAYEVAYKTPKEITICTQSSLPDYSVLGLYKLTSNSTIYVPLKYHIMEQL